QVGLGGASGGQDELQFGSKRPNVCSSTLKNTYQRCNASLHADDRETIFQFRDRLPFHSLVRARRAFDHISRSRSLGPRSEIESAGDATFHYIAVCPAPALRGRAV